MMHPHDSLASLAYSDSKHPPESGRDIQFPGNGGLVLSATQFGDPKSPQVLLLHGGGQTRHAWAHTATALARSGYCASCIDARGHGQSQWCPEGDYSGTALVSDLRAIIQSLPTSPYIVGASMGGLTAMLTLGEEPPLPYRGLVLVDVAPRLETKGVRRVIEFMRRHPDGFDSLDQVQDAVAAYNPTRKAPSSSQGLRKNLRQDANGRLHWHWDPAFLDHAVIPEANEGMFGRARLNLAASKLKLPILLIRGHHSDVLSEAGAQELLALVPHAKYRVIHQAGHMVAGDRNSIFTGAVLDFLQHLDPQGNHIRSTDRRLTP